MNQCGAGSRILPTPTQTLRLQQNDRRPNEFTFLQCCFFIFSPSSRFDRHTAEPPTTSGGHTPRRNDNDDGSNKSCKVNYYRPDPQTKSSFPPSFVNCSSCLLVRASRISLLCATPHSPARPKNQSVWGGMVKHHVRCCRRCFETITMSSCGGRVRYWPAVVLISIPPPARPVRKHSTRQRAFYCGSAHTEPDQHHAVCSFESRPGFACVSSSRAIVVSAAGAACWWCVYLKASGAAVRGISLDCKSAIVRREKTSVLEFGARARVCAHPMDRIIFLDGVSGVGKTTQANYSFSFREYCGQCPAFA